MSSAEMIPVQSVIFMCISMGIMLLGPIGYMVVAWVRRKATVSSVLLGMLGFILSFCTYGIIWCLYVVIRSGGFVTTNLSMSYYMVYAVLAGICSALWMYLLRRKHAKKHNRPWEGMCFYAGFALANSIKLCIPIVDNVRLTLMYNKMGVAKLQESMGEKESKLALEKLYQVSCKESSYFLINGLEVILLLIMFLAMGYLLDILLKSSKKSIRIILLLLLAVFQILAELPTQLLRTTALDIESKEIILTSAACIVVGIDFIITYKKKRNNCETQ